MFMRTTLSILTATAFVFAIGLTAVPSAYADNGENSTMVRKGRFVWRVPSNLNEKAVAQAPSAREQRGVVYDKGDLGSYVRHGRTVTKVYSGSPRPSAAKTDFDATRHRVLDHVKHKHYLP